MDARDARRLAHMGLLVFVADHLEIGSGQVTKDELWERYLATTPPELRTTRMGLIRYIWMHYREHLRGGQFHYQPILKGIRLVYIVVGANHLIFFEPFLPHARGKLDCA